MPNSIPRRQVGSSGLILLCHLKGIYRQTSVLLKTRSKPSEPTGENTFPSGDVWKEVQLERKWERKVIWESGYLQLQEMVNNEGGLYRISLTVSQPIQGEKEVSRCKRAAGGLATQTRWNSRVFKILLRAPAESQTSRRQTISHTCASLRYKVPLKEDWSILTRRVKSNRLESSETQQTAVWARWTWLEETARSRLQVRQTLLIPFSLARDHMMSECSSVPSCPLTNQIRPCPGVSELITVTLDKAVKTTRGCGHAGGRLLSKRQL